MKSNFEKAKDEILSFIKKSKVPEDYEHALNTLKWLLKLEPNADDALQLAALAHDIERADEKRKVKRADFNDYNKFKLEHAKNSARILREILTNAGIDRSAIDEACRLVEMHETGGDKKSDLLKEADSISFFDVNLPQYYKREGKEETLKRVKWGYKRLTIIGKDIVKTFKYENDEMINEIIKVISGNHK